VSVNKYFLEEYIILRTSNFHKHKLNIEIILPLVFSQSFRTRSTLLTSDRRLFYPDIKLLKICIARRISDITWTQWRSQEFLSHGPFPSSIILGNGQQRAIKNPLGYIFLKLIAIMKPMFTEGKLVTLK